MSEHPLHQLAMQIRYDLSAAQGKLSELMRQVGELEPLGAPRESFMNGPVTAVKCEACECGHPWHATDCSLASVRSSLATALPSESVGGESVG